MLTQERLKQLLHYNSEMGVWRWRVTWNRRLRAGDVAGTIRGDGYRRIKVDGRNYRSGRLAWLYMTGTWPLKTVDHRDLNKLNDRWDNLRLATNAQNNANKLGRGSSSGLKNIYFIRRDKLWFVSVQGAHAKTFKCLGQAIKHRNIVLLEQHGEFARFA